MTLILPHPDTQNTLSGTPCGSSCAPRNPSCTPNALSGSTNTAAGYPDNPSGAPERTSCIQKPLAGMPKIAATHSTRPPESCTAPYNIFRIPSIYLLATFISLATPHILLAQTGGTSTYSFLNLTPSARVAALGGKVNATPGNDPSLAFYNPSLLDSTSNRQLALNFVNHFAGINFGYASYAHSHRRAGNFAAGIHYINYGRFTGADEAGLLTNDFTAAEYAFNFTWSRRLPWLDSTLLAGVSAKPLLSVFERYSSYGLLADLGVTYCHPDGFFTATLVLRNMGGQLTPYAAGRREPVPFELQLGLSQRLRHAPFRFSLLLQHLEHPRMGYNRVNQYPAPGQTPVQESDLKHGFDLLFDEAMRHLLVGVECFPFRMLTLRAGYNYNRRQEMRVTTRPGMVGFSWGLGIHVARFHIDYARSSWHLAGASNHFSVCMALTK